MKSKILANLIGYASVAAAALLVASPAAAEEIVALTGDVKVERTVVENGTERTVLSAPEDVVPGDRLVFSTNYRNDSGEAIDDFVVTNPLPVAVVLAEYDPAFQVSVDGGNSFADLSALTVEDTEAGTRPAQVTDVTHIRWTLDRLEPGAAGSLSYNAFVR